MLAWRNQRQKRSVSNFNKDKVVPLSQLNSNVASIYCHQKKSSRNGYGGKGKQNCRNKGVCQGDDFSRGAIKFKNSARESRRNNGRASLKDSGFKDQKMYKNRRKQNTSRNEQNWTLNPDNYPKTNTKSNPNTSKKRQAIKEKKYEDITKRQIKQSYLKRYKEAISKIFKGLDIFNRGTISETNINKWIPQEALYFLGDIFQKIRSQRLNLSNEAFLDKCLPILYDSSEQDLKQFLESVNGKDIHNVSVNFSSSEKDVESPVQMKINKDTKLEEYRKSSYKPLIPFEELIDRPKPKPKAHSYLSKNTIEQKQMQKVPYFNTSSPSHNFSFEIKSSQKRVSPNIDNRSRQKDMRKSPIDRPLTSDKKVQYSQKQLDVPCFNFQLSDVKLYSTAKQNIQSMKKSENILQTTSKRTQTRNGGVILNFTPKEFESSHVRPRNSRIVHQKVNKQTHSERKRSGKSVEQDEDRIDNLSTKLEHYLKLNMEKIEKNRRFIFENTVPRA